MQARPMPLCDVRPSVCLSVTFVDSVKTYKHIFKIFSPSGSQTILVFPYQTSWQYSDALLMGSWNPGGVGKNCDLSQYMASLRAVNASTAKCNKLNCDGPWQVVTLIAGKRRSLLMAGDDAKVFVTGSLNVTPKTTKQHLIVRSGKSEA